MSRNDPPNCRQCAEFSGYSVTFAAEPRPIKSSELVWRPIAPCIANERRASNGSPVLRGQNPTDGAFTTQTSIVVHGGNHASRAVWEVAVLPSVRKPAQPPYERDIRPFLGGTVSTLKITMGSQSGLCVRKPSTRTAYRKTSSRLRSLLTRRTLRPRDFLVCRL